MFPALGAVLGLLYPVAGGVLRRGLKFHTCTNTLTKLFLTIPGIFGSPHVFVNSFCFHILHTCGVMGLLILILILIYLHSMDPTRITIILTDVEIFILA